MLECYFILNTENYLRKGILESILSLFLLSGDICSCVSCSSFFNSPVDSTSTFRNKRRLLITLT